MRNFSTLAMLAAVALAFIAITAMAFTACTKKNETAATVSAESYAKILNGDLSDFAGTWVNGRGERIQLRANGTFNAGQRTGGFTHGLGTLTTNGTNYEWIVFMEGEDEGFEVLFFPVGVGVKNFAGDVVETHISNDRIFMVSVGSSNEVYYRKGELSSPHPQR